MTGVRMWMTSRACGDLRSAPLDLATRCRLRRGVYPAPVLPGVFEPEGARVGRRGAWGTNHRVFHTWSMT